MDKFNIQKLNGKANWTVWKLQITSNLQYHGFEDILSGNLKMPEDLPADASAEQKKSHTEKVRLYKRANGFAITLIITNVDDVVLKLIFMLGTAREMWVKLETAYEQTSEPRPEHLYLQLLEYKMEAGNSVANLKKLWMELNEESWRVDKCRLPGTLLILRILSTLPNEYFEFRTTWESIPRNDRTVEYLLERLTMVETRLSRINETATVSSVSALVGKKPPKVKYNNGSSLKPKRDMSKVKCYGRKEFGHVKNKCPKVKSAPAKSSAIGSALFGEVLLISVPTDGLWIADSGATQHMTKSKDYFVNYTSFNTPKPVTLRNKGVMMAYGEGDIEVESFVDGQCLNHTLKNVWYTPDVVKNLFSVPAAADKGIAYHLDRYQCSLVKENTTLVVGERHDGLYKLHLRAVLPCNPVKVLVAEKPEKLQVWHERLGHQTNNILKSI